MPPLEGLGEPADHRHRLVEAAGVHHRLPAARLPLPKIHLDTQPADHRLARVGEEGVVEAGHQKGYAHLGTSPAVSSSAHSSSGTSSERRAMFCFTWSGVPAPTATATTRASSSG